MSGSGCTVHGSGFTIYGWGSRIKWYRDARTFIRARPLSTQHGIDRCQPNMVWATTRQVDILKFSNIWGRKLRRVAVSKLRAIRRFRWHSIHFWSLIILYLKPWSLNLEPLTLNLKPQIVDFKTTNPWTYEPMNPTRRSPNPKPLNSTPCTRILKPTHQAT